MSRRSGARGRVADSELTVSNSTVQSRYAQMVDRDRHLAIRTSAEEASMLKALAEAEGISQSDYVRLFIRRAYAEKFGAKKPKRV